MTIIHQFENIVKQYPKNTALGYLLQGRYKKITYQELDNWRLQLASYFKTKGFQPGEKIALLLPNSPEWIISDLAAATSGLIVVPIHTTYNHIFIQNVIRHSGAEYLVVHKDLYKKHQDTIQKLDFKIIFIVGFIEEEMSGTNIIAWPLSYKTAKVGYIESVPKEADVHTIIYTSGTTGDPKGVMLTHKNLVADALSAKRSIEIYSYDRFFSFMPLSHAFERMAGYYCPLFSGADVYFAQNKDTLIYDIKKAKPTVLSSVPRIFEKIYGKIFDKIETGPKYKKKMFFKALKLSAQKRKAKLNFGQYILWFCLDLLVFWKLRAVLGGNLRLAISGGASLDVKIIRFFEDLGVTIIEGYGLTETSPIVSVNPLVGHRAGTVGKAIDCNQIKILDNKEILVKGDNVMSGYYKNENMTAEVMDADGWLYTGDLGFLDKEGFLTIIGRAKDMIVLSTGKNIFPEAIENVLNESRYISQSMIYGDRDKHISALIVPNFEQLTIWCQHHNIRLDLNDDRIQNFYKEKIEERVRDFAKIEQVNHFKLISTEFSQENGLLTPTLKLKRSKIREKYRV